MLSFAGRLQLIKSVLQGINLYWANAFILPKKVTAKIDSMLNNFLWAGCLNGKYNAKVSWEEVCSPYFHGGLNVTRMSNLNTALACKKLWDICSRKDSLWVKWVHTVILKGRSLGQVSFNGKCSWVWRRLLKIRPFFFQYFSYTLGNGKDIAIWWDNWLPCGALCDNYPKHVASHFGISLNAKVDSLIHSGSWRWPLFMHLSSDVHCILRTIVSMVIPPNLTPDKPFWFPESNGLFSTASAIKMLSKPSVCVPWWNLVWFKRRVPRFAFISWLACKQKLTTRDVLGHWGVSTSLLCPFCSLHPESVAHIFFDCPFSLQIWIKILHLLDIVPSRLDFNSTINWLAGLVKFQCFKSDLISLAFSAFVYHVWRSRNELVFQGNLPNRIDLFNAILNAIRYASFSWKNIPRNRCNFKLVVGWGLNPKILSD